MLIDGVFKNGASYIAELEFPIINFAPFNKVMKLSNLALNKKFEFFVIKIFFITANNYF